MLMAGSCPSYSKENCSFSHFCNECQVLGQTSTCIWWVQCGTQTSTPLPNVANKYLKILVDVENLPAREKTHVSGKLLV